MKKTNLVVLAILCSLLISCADAKKEEEHAEERPVDLPESITLINNTSAQGLGITLFDMFGNTELIEFIHSDTQQVTTTKPIVISMMFNPMDLRFFRLYPGETISIEDGVNNDFLLTTKDSIRDNELRLSNSLPFSMKDFGSGTVSLRAAGTLYKSRIAQLNSFSRSHQVSGEFSAYLASVLRLFEINNRIKVAIKERRYSEIGSLKHIINDDKSLGLISYDNALINYNKLIKDSISTAGEYSILGHVRFVEELGLQKDVEDHLLFSLVKHHKLSNGTNALEVAVNHYSPSPNNSYLKDYLQKNLELTKLSYAAVRGNQMMQVNGSTVLFEEVLEKLRNKVIYVDFWASWCGPCIAQVPYSKKLEDRFQGQEVVFMSLSMDKDRYKWEKKSGELGLNAGNNFLMVSSFDAPLAKALGIKEIPRYVLINREGQIVNQNASRPQDPELVEEIEKLLK